MTRVNYGLCLFKYTGKPLDNCNMKLSEIIETVKHDAEYFADPQTGVQAGRAFEANKILNMLYKLENLKNEAMDFVVMQAEGSDGAEGAAVGKARKAKGVRDWEEDFAHENGNYQNRCTSCGELFIGHKRRPLCKICA